MRYEVAAPRATVTSSDASWMTTHVEFDGAAEERGVFEETQPQRKGR